MTPASEPLAASEEKNAFTAISGEVQAIFDKCKGAVIRIEAMDAYGPHAGTGFFIDPAGTIYTHYSVAGRSWNLTVEFAGKKFPATCLLADERSGVSLLSIQAGPTPFLPIGNSAELKVASAVVAIGYPRELPVSPTFGLVAGFDQKFFGAALPTTHIRANVPVQAGESGAPLLNAKGQVVGILVCQFDYGAVCLSLPIQAAEKVRMDYLRFGSAHPGWVGVTPKPVDGDDENGEVTVERMDNDGPAMQAGLKVGDVICRVGRMPIRRLVDVRDASFYLTADEMVPVEVMREGKMVKFEVKVASPPGASMALPPTRMSDPGRSPLTLRSSRP